tara:strand:+ start:437 stop:1279 length:843 start_codon:yes stop_codon:yes gene_type:complete
MAIRKFKKKAAMTSPRTKIVFPLESDLDDTVLSVAGGNTINLVTEYNVHSCPDGYTYRPVQYLSVRDRTSRIGMIYVIEKILIFDPLADEDRTNQLNNLISDPQLEFTEDEEKRFINYNVNNKDYPENNRFYFLKNYLALPHKPKPPVSDHRTHYFLLSDFTVGSMSTGYQGSSPIQSEFAENKEDKSWETIKLEVRKIGFQEMSENPEKVFQNWQSTEKKDGLPEEKQEIRHHKIKKQNDLECSVDQNRMEGESSDKGILLLLIIIMFLILYLGNLLPF